jgi:hypothetical protein
LEEIPVAIPQIMAYGCYKAKMQKSIPEFHQANSSKKPAKWHLVHNLSPTSSCLGAILRIKKQQTNLHWSDIMGNIVCMYTKLAGQ